MQKYNLFITRYLEYIVKTVLHTHMLAIANPTAPVSINALERSFYALDNINYRCSPPKHLSEHTFKSLK